MAEKTAQEKHDAGEELSHEDVRAIEHPEEAQPKPAGKPATAKDDG